MLEWYRVGFTLAQMISECCELIKVLCRSGTLQPNGVQHLRYAELLRDSIDYDPLHPDAKRLLSIANSLLGTSMPTLGKLAEDAATLLDLLMSHVVIPKLDPQLLSVVTDYPADQAQLARLHPDDPRLAERFEIYFQGMELANGYRELTVAQEQEQRFAADCQRRAAAGSVSIDPDPKLLGALLMGLPDCCGVAAGLDRIMMCCTGAAHIEDTLSFMPGR
jgi:lysyl-tRNA synthetase class 2